MAVSGPFREVYTYYGLAADTKPGDDDNILEGSKFIETDTLDEFVYLGGTWVDITPT